MKIELARIDDRFIHGQVLTKWVKLRPIDRIIIVSDSVAADEMHMGIGVGIEPFHTLDRGHTHDLALILEVGQVPVDGSHGQVGDVVLQVGVDGLCGGVGVCASQIFQNRIALSETLFASCHGNTSFHLRSGCERE